MADFMLLGLFKNVEDTADVIDALREKGVNDDSVAILSYIPYPETYFGRKPARLWFLPFALGGAAVGALLAWFITYWTPEIYPIHVGGQGLHPIPPSVIIYFELIALCSMVAAFIGFLLQNRFPILVKEMYDERITEGYIGVEVAAQRGQVDDVVGIFENNGAISVKREDGAPYKPQGIRHLLFWGGVATAGLVALAVPLLLSYEIVDVPWINNMANTISIKPQEGPRMAAPDAAIPVQGPVMINGQPATRPLEATERSLTRGQQLYEINCAVCHGVNGGGNGPISRYYTTDAVRDKFPQGVPVLAGRGLPQEYIFTVGWNGIVRENAEGELEIRMPSLASNLSAGDLWDIANYIQSMPAPAAE